MGGLEPGAFCDGLLLSGGAAMTLRDRVGAWLVPPVVVPLILALLFWMMVVSQW
jgi:hypothetical protein